jgi:hypothetical protein
VRRPPLPFVVAVTVVWPFALLAAAVVAVLEDLADRLLGGTR